LYLSTLETSPTVAVIKYWGKKDVKLNTPMNSSVSVTLDQVSGIGSFANAVLSADKSIKQTEYRFAEEGLVVCEAPVERTNFAIKQNCINLESLQNLTN